MVHTSILSSNQNNFIRNAILSINSPIFYSLVHEILHTTADLSTAEMVCLAEEVLVAIYIFHYGVANAPICIIHSPLFWESHSLTHNAPLLMSPFCSTGLLCMFPASCSEDGLQKCQTCRMRVQHLWQWQQQQQRQQQQNHYQQQQQQQGHYNEITCFSSPTCLSLGDSCMLM